MSTSYKGGAIEAEFHLTNPGEALATLKVTMKLRDWFAIGEALSDGKHPEWPLRNAIAQLMAHGNKEFHYYKEETPPPASAMTSGDDGWKPVGFDIDFPDPDVMVDLWVVSPANADVSRGRRYPAYYWSRSRKLWCLWGTSMTFAEAESAVNASDSRVTHWRLVASPNDMPETDAAYRDRLRQRIPASSHLDNIDKAIGSELDKVGARIDCPRRQT